MSISCHPALLPKEGFPNYRLGSIVPTNVVVTITINEKVWSEKIVINEAPSEEFECGAACEEPDFEEIILTANRGNAATSDGSGGWWDELPFPRDPFWGGVFAVLKVPVPDTDPEEFTYPLFALGGRAEANITIALSAAGAPWPVYVRTQDNTLHSLPYEVSINETREHDLDEDGYPDGDSPLDLSTPYDWPVAIRFVLPPR